MSKVTTQKSFKEIEKSFNDFILEVGTTTEAVSGRINVDELNEIGDSIVSAKQFLTSFANGEKKSVRTRAYNQLKNVPLIGDWAKGKVEEIQTQALKDSSVKEVLNDIFDSFEIKKKRLIELTEIASNIRVELMKQEIKVGEYISDLEHILSSTEDPVTRMKALEMSIQAQTSDKIIKDQVYNKINFILELMEALMIRMSKTLPAIKSQLLNETSISGMINSISDSVKMMSSLQELTNEIAKTSTENIQGLIIDVTKELTNGADIEFYKQSAETNKKFHQTLISCEQERIKNNIDSFKKLKEISDDTTLQLQQRTNSQIKALESGLKGV